MAAPTGNQFWKQRSKHGRSRLFETPALLWEAACEYFQWCDDNPLMEMLPMVISEGKGLGSSIKTAEIPKMRAYTLQGLCLYLDCNVRYLEQFENSLPKDEEDFSTIITRIREVVFNQKFTGAAAGFLNANIISRDLGLVDKKHQEVDQKVDWGNLDMDFS